MVTVAEFIKGEKIYYSDRFIEDPTVSVILPTYCRGDNGLLKRAIDSVLEQTFDRFELIIVDDGSVDGTQELVKSYLGKDTRLLYIRNDCNSGLPALRVNQGILHARGEYIAYQFDDDRWTQNGLELLVNEIEKQNGLALVYGNWDSYHVKDKIQELHREDFYYYKLIAGNFIANNSVIHPRKVFEIYGMYDCHLVMRRLCDWDLWLRFGKEIPFIHLDKVVSRIDIMVDNSLGDTVTYDLSTSRLYSGQARNAALIPSQITEYVLDSLEPIFDEALRLKVYNRHILPWMLRHVELYQDRNIYAPAVWKKMRTIVTKCDYDSVVNIMVENFTSLRPDQYQYIYIPEMQLQYKELLDGDILLLCRATTQNSLDIVRRIKAEQRPITVLYFIDDDLLNIYKLGEEFAYLAPGTAMYEIVEDLLRLSDQIVAFSPNIATTIIKYSNRVSILKTNVLAKYLSEADSYEEAGPFKIAFMGGSARKEEFADIQDDLVRISEKHGDEVSFTFMGYIPEKMKKVKTSFLTYQVYTSSYYQYMNQLSMSHFNLMLCPLYDNEFKRGKSPVKLLEACCCDTIGLYSDVPVYDCITDGVHGYKIANGTSWFDKIDQIIQSPIEDKKRIFSQAVTMVKEKFTTQKGLPQFELALKTAKLANYVQNKTILFVSHSAYLAGAENHLFRHCLLAKKAGFPVVLALPESSQGQGMAMQKMAEEHDIEIAYLQYYNNCEIEDVDRRQAVKIGEPLAAMLERYEIALIHSSTLIPAMGYVAKMLHIPYIASLYATETDFVCSNPEAYFAPDFVHSDSVMYANKWQDKLDCVSRCIRSYIPPEFMQTRELKPKTSYRIAISGTMQERKRQRELIEAIGLLKGKIDIELYLFGYDHFFPDYKTQCIETAQKYGINEKIFWQGLVPNIPTAFDKLNIDMLVCASVFESFPQVILEAMALEIAVVTTPVGGVREIIFNEKNGFICSGFTAQDIALAIKNCIAHIENQAIKPVLQNAKEVIMRECSLTNVSYQLFDIYLESVNVCCKKYGKIAPYGLPSNYQIIDDSDVPSRFVETDILVFSKGLAGKRSYNLRCEINEMSQLGIIFASEKSGFGGRIVMNLFAEGRLLRSAELPLDRITLEKWSYFTFQPIYGCGGKVFTVELTFEYSESSAFWGLYEDRRNRTFVYKVFNKLGHPLKGMNVLYADCRK